jgi:hypothetical protein
LVVARRIALYLPGFSYQPCGVHVFLWWGVRVSQDRTRLRIGVTMDDVVIRAIGKKFSIGHQARERYVALRDVVSRGSRTLPADGRRFAVGTSIVEVT